MVLQSFTYTIQFNYVPSISEEFSSSPEKILMLEHEYVFNFF